jgi:hypothetical protein
MSTKGAAILGACVIVAGLILGTKPEQPKDHDHHQH